MVVAVGLTLFLLQYSLPAALRSSTSKLTTTCFVKSDASTLHCTSILFKKDALAHILRRFQHVDFTFFQKDNPWYRCVRPYCVTRTMFLTTTKTSRAFSKVLALHSSWVTAFKCYHHDSLKVGIALLGLFFLQSRLNLSWTDWLKHKVLRPIFFTSSQ